MRKLLLLAATICCACGSDPPSCQDSMTHYYNAGCTFVDLQTNTPTSLNDAILACQGINREVPDNCRGKFEDWVSCVDGVANDKQCTDCTQETDALFACK